LNRRQFLGTTAAASASGPLTLAASTDAPPASNEDNHDRSGTYDGRFTQFYKAIKAKYPDLQLIATTPVKSVTPDVIDDHYYHSASQFYDDVGHYDKTDRQGPKIFVGEWATREGGPTPNFNAALGDAAWMTGMERNSDIIIMSCYAPLFVNVNTGGMQWESDLIGYDTLTSYGSPSYYAQVMFSNHVGDQILDALAELSHFKALNPKFMVAIHSNQVNPFAITKLLRAKGAGATCYVMSENSDLDGREMDLETALNETVGAQMGTLISCIPGRLGYFEDEDGRCILERLR